MTSPWRLQRHWDVIITSLSLSLQNVSTWRSRELQSPVWLLLSYRKLSWARSRGSWSWTSCPRRCRRSRHTWPGRRYPDPRPGTAPASSCRCSLGSASWPATRKNINRTHFPVLTGTTNLWCPILNSTPRTKWSPFFKSIFMNEMFCSLICISQKLVRKDAIDNKSALNQVMAWRRTGDKPLSEPILTQFSDKRMRHQGEMNLVKSRDLVTVGERMTSQEL